MCEYNYIRCLVLSDDEKAEECTCRLLQSFNNKRNEVHVVATAREVEEELRKSSYDVLLVELHKIEDQDIERLKNCHPDAAVLLITDYSEYKYIIRMTSASGFLVLPRPVKVSTFLQALQIGLRGQEKKHKEGSKPEEIYLLEQVKLLLVLHEKMSEMDAHRYVEKISMDYRMSKHKACEYIMERYV